MEGCFTEGKMQFCAVFGMGLEYPQIWHLQGGTTHKPSFFSLVGKQTQVWSMTVL